MSGIGSSSKDADDFLKRTILSKTDRAELKALRIAVKRRNIASTGIQLPLERSIDDSAKIVPLVHIRNDCRKIRYPPIFGKGIKVNQEHWDDRQVFSKERLKALSKSRSRSPKHWQKKKSRTRSRERSRSPRYSHRSKSRTRSRERANYRSRSREKEKYRSKIREKKREKGIFEPPSDDESHKPFCTHYKETKMSRERRKSKSPTPLRPGEYRPGHPDLALRYKKQSSRSPGYSSRRSASPRRSRSRSPRKSSSDKRSLEKRRSKSPVKKYERYKFGEKRGSPIKSDKYSSRRSRTPSRSEKRRSRSPPYKVSGSSSSRDYRSRSPRKKYYDDRNRSPRDNRRRSRSPNKYREGEAPPGYGYYEGDYWMPGHPVRPGFPMPRFYPPPAFYPRGMIPGPMMMPRVIMHPYGPFPRQPLPIYNSGAVRPRIVKPQTTATVTSETEQSEGTQLTLQEVHEGNSSVETAQKQVNLQAGQERENSEGNSEMTENMGKQENSEIKEKEKD